VVKRRFGIRIRCPQGSQGLRIGLFKRKDLVRPSNPKAVFHDIRNHLGGMSISITRDEELAQEIINILFCKILDEQATAPEDTVTLRAGIDEKLKTSGSACYCCSKK
jgi:type I restriction enzyme M protein